jgi:hypothetical protein
MLGVCADSYPVTQLIRDSMEVTSELSLTTKESRRK